MSRARCVLQIVIGSMLAVKHGMAGDELTHGVAPRLPQHPRGPTAKTSQQATQGIAQFLHPARKRGAGSEKHTQRPGQSGLVMRRLEPASLSRLRQ